MEAVRKIVSAEMLKPIIELPWVLKGLQVEVIVKHYCPLNVVICQNQVINN